MLKWSVTSSGKNHKSCRIFHNESNKTGFSFLWIVYDFLRNLHESAKHKYYLRTKLRSGPWKIFGFTSIPLNRRWAPGIHFELAIGSPGVAGGGSAKILARTHRSSAEGEQERGLGSAVVWFGGLVRGEGAAGGVDRDTRRRSPLEPLLQRVSGRGKATSSVDGSWVV
jgi:hypothetical protein